MDEMVLRAQEKWPNVPNVYGWLHLDARGRWFLRGERVEHRSMSDFLHRNAALDARGAAFVQNGPQRVFYTYDAAPMVLRFAENSWEAYPQMRDNLMPQGAAWVDEEALYFLFDDGLAAVLDDRDLLAILPFLQTQDGKPWAGVCAQGDVLILSAGKLTLDKMTRDALLQSQKLCPNPQPESAQDCVFGVTP